MEQITLDPAAPTLGLYLAAAAVVVVAAIVQSTLGVGFGVIAAPILALIDPALVPGPMLVLALSISFLGLLRDGRDIRFGPLGWALSGRVIASIAGGLTASLLAPKAFLLLFAGLILAAVALSLSGLKFAPTRRSLFLAGVASGYMGTITSVGTPPMALVYQHTRGPEVRANMSAFLVFGAIVSIVSLTAFGAFDRTEMMFAVLLLPALGLGFLLSGPLRKLADNGWMRPAMLTLCVLASLLLIVRALGIDP